MLFPHLWNSFNINYTKFFRKKPISSKASWILYSAMPLMFPTLYVSRMPLMFPRFFKIWKHKGHSGTQMTLYVSKMPLMFPRFWEIFESTSGNIRGTALYLLFVLLLNLLSVYSDSTESEIEAEYLAMRDGVDTDLIGFQVSVTVLLTIRLLFVNAHLGHCWYWRVRQSFNRKIPNIMFVA